jgi:hypothetical protein
MNGGVRIMYPWPIGDFDYAMDVALDIAMNYLERTGQAVAFKEVQSKAATAIVAAWKGGVRHRVRLANAAIKAVEQAQPFRKHVEIAVNAPAHLKVVEI